MKVGERWAISGSRNNFVLTESSVITDKNGKEKISTKETFHPTIEQCLRKIVKAESVKFVDEQMAVDVTALKVFQEEMERVIKEVARTAQIDHMQAGALDQE